MIKNTNLILTAILCTSLFLGGCHQQPKKPTGTPEEIQSVKTLGVAYLEENQLDKAEAEFLKLIAMDPGDASGYANLGIVYLRLAKYPEAEKQLKKALEITPKDPDVRLILAKVYEMSKRPQEAIDLLEKSLTYAPGHVKSLYTLSELYSTSADPAAQEKRLTYTKELIEKSPANIVPRMMLIDILIKVKDEDQALAQLEALPKIFPAFPKESVEYYDKTLAAIRNHNLAEAATDFMIFHNYIKITPPYQSGVLELKGPEGFLGQPVITFDQNKTPTTLTDWKAVLAAIHFTDITTSAGLSAPGATTPPDLALAAADYDGDGDMDLFVCRYDQASSSYVYQLLRNEWGKYTDVAREAGLRSSGKVTFAGFFDYDNDGFLDLYLVKEGKNLLYKNNGKGAFTDVSSRAGVNDEAPGNKAVFFDYDHDGDLDIYLLRSGNNLLYRNNADGTFTETAAAAGLSCSNTNSTDAAFADFDDDGDIDLVVTNQEGTNHLFSNQRQGIFTDVTAGSGLKNEKGATSVSVGDFNNDGFPDLFITSATPGASVLYANKGDGTFSTIEKSSDITSALTKVAAHDAAFLDFDNDGYLDLLVTGKGVDGTKSGVVLFHNDASGDLFVADNLLPDDLTEGAVIVPFDYNEDGDMDVAITGTATPLRLFRNDGGNNFHYVKMKLVGLRTGSGKNNYFGIGAKVEVRAGNLYQSKVVTSPNVLFGLGPRTKADVIRILWTNGVPQNIFFPTTDQDLVEQQELKGSCPFLYGWNGKEYVFVKDIMWRSALGMPMGIMGEDKERTYATAAPSVDYIKIPGRVMVPQDGKYILQVTDELWESIYFDKVQLIAVDHPDSVDVYVDERFMPSPKPGYRLYQAGKKYFPVSVTDDSGRALRSLITHKDNQYISGYQPTRYQGIVHQKDLILDLGRVPSTAHLKLYLNGWIFPSDASINAALLQSQAITLIPPMLQAQDAKGKWVTIEDNISFPMGKDKTMVVDLSGKLPAGAHLLRLRTNMEIYWDYIFFTLTDPQAPVETHVMNPVAADLHYRGFSRMYRKGGRYGPHWFDYSEVTTGQKWRDLTGYYTRFGDVLPLLLAADDKYIINNAGDETTITFDEGSLPTLRKGWKRDFLIHTEGWVKDGDLNTATGQQVEPLPYHGMKKYPYGPEASYPSDPDHQQYLEEYNTRRVTTEAFRRAIADAKTTGDK